MGHNMTQRERYQLEAYLRAKKPITWIAQAMGFCRKTIYNEINRGAVAQIKQVNGYDRDVVEYPDFGQAFKSITTDNGPEFLEYEQLIQSIHGGKRFNVYYCHSYAAWEKGTNERNNRMLRRKWPKGTSFTNVTQGEVDDYVSWLNHYPRKSLGWRCPAEVMETG